MDGWAEYETAYAHYQAGSYEEAGLLFLNLVMQAPFEPRFWEGLAATKQMEKKYPEALKAWALVALLKEEDPMPHLHAAECLKELGDLEEMNKALTAVEHKSGVTESLLIRCQALRGNL